MALYPLGCDRSRPQSALRTCAYQVDGIANTKKVTIRNCGLQEEVHKNSTAAV